jgi:hypothetical protein
VIVRALSVSSSLFSVYISLSFSLSSLRSLGAHLQRRRGCLVCKAYTSGEWNAEWVGGLLQSSAAGNARPRASAIDGVILARGSIPPCAGFAPCDSFSSIWPWAENNNTKTNYKN